MFPHRRFRHVSVMLPKVQRETQADSLIAPDAVDQLKKAFKGLFKKKPKKTEAESSTATEPTKTDAKPTETTPAAPAPETAPAPVAAAPAAESTPAEPKPADAAAPAPEAPKPAEPAAESKSMIIQMSVQSYQVLLDRKQWSIHRSEARYEARHHAAPGTGSELLEALS